MQIRHHPDPNPALSSTQGRFQRGVWCLFWAVPGSLSHLPFQWHGAVGDLARSPACGLQQVAEHLRTQAPKKQENKFAINSKGTSLCNNVFVCACGERKKRFNMTGERTHRPSP